MPSKMVKHQNNDIGIDINDFDAICLPLWQVGIKEQLGLSAAISNQKLIKETALVLRSLGDLEVTELEEPEKSREPGQHTGSAKEHFTNCLKKIIETLDIVLEWLERSARKSRNETEKKNENKKQNPDDCQKKESVLRGLFHITEIGSYTCFVSLLKRAAKSLDLPNNLYNAKRQHIEECLKEVEDKKESLSQLVAKACDLLQDIAKEPQLNGGKTAQFNNNVMQANAIIKSSMEMLSSAEETIDELMKVVHVMKWLSRAFRFVGFGVTCYLLYHAPSTSTFDSLATYFPPTALSLVEKFVSIGGLKNVSLVALCAVAGYSWLALFPSMAYAFRDHLEELKLKHKRLKISLHELENRFKILHDHAPQVN